MSRPIVVTACMLAPPNRGNLNSTHFHGTHVPREEHQQRTLSMSRFPSEQVELVVAAVLTHREKNQDSRTPPARSHHQFRGGEREASRQFAWCGRRKALEASQHTLTVLVRISPAA